MQVEIRLVLWTSIPCDTQFEISLCFTVALSRILLILLAYLYTNEKYTQHLDNLNMIWTCEINGFRPNSTSVCEVFFFFNLIQGV